MKRRRNPFDAKPLVESRAPLGVIIALTELDAAGVPMRQWGEYILVDAEAADAAGLGKTLRDAAKTNGYVVATDMIDAEDMTDEIVDSLTRTFFVMGWLSYKEGTTGRDVSGDPFDVAPKRTSPKAKKFARAYVRKLEEANGIPIGLLYEIARNAPGKHYREPSPERFGHYIAMRAIGSGVSWEDDHPDIGMKVPRDEWYY